MKSFLCAAVVLVLCFPPAVCHGREYSVPPGASIQAAIDLCRNGDRVVVDSGVYTQRVTINKRITLAGKGADATILDGQGTGPVIRVTCPGIVRIANCTVRNGRITAPPDQAVKGGGICNDTASLFLKDVCVSGNIIRGGNRGSVAGADAYGGGVFSTGPLDLRNCVFVGNEAYGGLGTTSPVAQIVGEARGGGAYASSNLRIDNCVFSLNVCVGGYYSISGWNYCYRTIAAGAGCCSESNEAYVTGTSFEGNLCGDPVSSDEAMWWDDIYGRNPRHDRGAGYAQCGGRARLLGCTFRDNVAARGGAFHNTGEAVLEDCLFLDNLAKRGGGAMNEGQLSALNSAFDGNTALHGGGLHNTGSLYLADCYFERNQGPFANLIYLPGSFGGAVFNQATVDVDRSTFMLNGAEDGGAFWNQGVLNIRNSAFRENRADRGGGVCNDAVFQENRWANTDRAGALLSLEDCRFDQNQCLGRLKAPGTHGYPAPIHGEGGAIFNTSTAQIRRCIFVGHLATGNCSAYGGGYGGAFGGAIRNRSEGVLLADSCTFHSNSVEGESFSEARGGAVMNSGFAALSNSTFSANLAQGDGFPSWWSGGVFGGGALFSDGTTCVSHCTFVSNSVAATEGVAAHFAGAAICAPCVVTIGNSVVEDAATLSFRSCWGSFESAGWNLFEDTSSMTLTVARATDRVNTEALLGPVVDVCRGQLACPLLPGSPALDAGSVAGARYDQRGLRRPRDLAQYPNAADSADIGALEMSSHDVTLSLEYVVSTSAPGQAQTRIVLHNIGAMPVQQAVLAVLLPPSSSLVSCSQARVINGLGRLVLLGVESVPAGQCVEIELVFHRGSASTPCEISARAYSLPRDEFTANNTMTIPVP